MVVTAGVVATKDEWIALDLRWLPILKRYDMPVFHMVDVAHWNGPIKEWPFVNGKRDEARRRAMLGELLDASVGIIQGFVTGLVRCRFSKFCHRFSLNSVTLGR